MTYSITQNDTLVKEFNSWKDVLTFASYNTGFYVTHNAKNKTVRWTDIQEANSFGNAKVSEIFS